MTSSPPQATSKQATAMTWIIVATVCIGSFMGQLDASITQLVLPSLERQFDASISEGSWVAVMFLLVVSVMLRHKGVGLGQIDPHVFEAHPASPFLGMDVSRGSTR